MHGFDPTYGCRGFPGLTPMYYWKPALDKLVKALLEAHGEDTATWPELADNDPHLIQRHKEYTSIRHVDAFLPLSCRSSESNAPFSLTGG
jgi:hypothetical protein